MVRYYIFHEVRCEFYSDPIFKLLLKLNCIIVCDVKGGRMVYIFTNVSEERTVSIFEKLVRVYQTTWCQSGENSTHRSHCHHNVA
jgi:hypothetical protein